MWNDNPTPQYDKPHYVEFRLGPYRIEIQIQRLPNIWPPPFDIDIAPREATDELGGGLSLDDLGNDIDIRIIDGENNEVADTELLSRIVLRPREQTDLEVGNDSTAPMTINPALRRSTQVPAASAEAPTSFTQLVRIVTWQAVIDKAFEHGRAHPEREVGGVCIGKVSRDADGQFLVEVTEILPAEHTVNRNTSITFTPATWRTANAIIEQLYQHDDEQMIGWYHTHPGFGIFMSDSDRFVHGHFFKETWHVALVLDPLKQEYNFYTWQQHEGTRVIELCPVDRLVVQEGHYVRSSPSQSASPETVGPKAAPDPPATGTTVTEARAAARASSKSDPLTDIP